MAYELSNGHVTTDDRGQLEMLFCYLAAIANYYSSAVWQYTVGYPSDSLASCYMTPVAPNASSARVLNRIIKLIF